MAEPLLTLRDIIVRHGGTTVLDVPAFSVEEGDVLAIIGPNGAGKSTLLRVLGLLQKPSEGSVWFRGEKISRGNESSIRRRMGSVFQSPLLLSRTLYDNAALGLKLHGCDRRAIEMRLQPWLVRLSISHLAAQDARTLSGGEAQRTSLARALALSPELLLLDEPFSSLDALTRETLLGDLQQILNETGITTVLVTHDLHEARMLGERVGVMKQGRILQLGSRDDVFGRPGSEEVAAVTGVANRIPGRVTSVSDRHVTVHFCGGTVRVPGQFAPGARVLLCLRGEDIDLCRPGQTGPKEPDCVEIHGSVVTLTPWMAQFRVTVRLGDRTIIAFLSKARSKQVLLQERDPVIVRFSSADMHVIISDNDGGSAETSRADR